MPGEDLGAVAESARAEEFARRLSDLPEGARTAAQLEIELKRDRNVVHKAAVTLKVGTTIDPLIGRVFSAAEVELVREYVLHPERRGELVYEAKLGCLPPEPSEPPARRYWQDSRNALPRLRERRKELGLSQRRLSELAACSRPTITALEDGRNAASRALQERIAEALALPSDDLFAEMPVDRAIAYYLAHPESGIDEAALQGPTSPITLWRAMNRRGIPRRPRGHKTARWYATAAERRARKPLEGGADSCPVSDRWGSLAKSRWGGRAGGPAGAVHGIENSRNGNPGPKRKVTSEQEDRIWVLWGQGLTHRQIAKEVFGDDRLKDRVRRLLHSDAVA